MKPLKNWDTVQAAGDYASLPVNAYVCKIIDVKIEKNKKSNGEHLKLAIDVCEGEYSGFFATEFKNNPNEDKWWGGTYIQNIPDESSDKYEQHCRFFKRFINQIEDSNPGYHWDWNEKGLKGKLIGVLFKGEEKLSKAGNVYIRTTSDSTLTVQDVKNGKFKIPEIKRLPNAETFMDLGAGAFPGVPNVTPDENDDVLF